MSYWDTPEARRLEKYHANQTERKEKPEVFPAATILLTDTRGNLIMQLREDKPGVFLPGMISLFGGSIHPDELPQEAAIRELKEETDLEIPLAFLCYSEGNKQEYGREMEVFSYYATDIQPSEITLGEGTAVVIGTPEMMLDCPLLVPDARTTISFYLGLNG